MIDIATNTYLAFDQYEKKFSTLMANMPDRRPWMAKEKEEIISIAKDCLGIKQEWIPQIKTETVKIKQQPKFNIHFLKFTSWENTIGTAHLYIPDDIKDKRPFVILCCGHEQHGKLSPCYQMMARRLARQGAVVLVPDNIGQGEREPMGHADAVVPFACGLSVQGLIVMETMAWIQWANQQQFIDQSKISAIGNSGGGLLTLFLGALCPDISVIVSSGYPSTFEFIARKEKKHCHCNILPGIVGKLEMWQLYGCIAPKPLFILQGIEDNFFPEDVFYHTARKTATVYEKLGQLNQLRYGTFKGGHMWNEERRIEILRFLCEKLDMLIEQQESEDMDECLSSNETCLPKWPKEALTIDQLAMNISHQVIPQDICLWDVFKPTVDLEKIDAKSCRSFNQQIFAQFEAFTEE